MLFDHHIHSKYSVFDSASEIVDIIRAAKEFGLDAIAVSDHDAIEGSLGAAGKSSDDLLIIPGMEVSSLDGHIVVLGVRELIERDLSARETIRRAHDLGGIAIAAHPYDTFRRGVKDLCWELDFDAIEINGHCLYGNTKAENAAKEHGKPLVGGSDAHALNGIGVISTEVGGSSPEEIFENIRKGRCRPIYRKNKVSLKTSIITDKISRKYHLSRKL